MNPFSDQWSDTPPVNSNPAPNFYVPPAQPVPYASSSGRPPQASSSQQYADGSFRNVNINQTNLQPTAQSNADRTVPKPNSTLPLRILNEIFSNHEMTICKLFYLFFYSAFGSLFPLIGIYFKQQGMSATETGILIGCRYIVEIFASPFWANIAVRFNKGKTILVGSLISWIILTSALAFIRPPAAACVSYNGSSFILFEPYQEDGDGSGYESTVKLRNKRWTLGDQSLVAKSDERISYFKSGISQLEMYKKKHKEKLEKELRSNRFAASRFDQQMPLAPNHVIGKSPLTIEYSVNYDENMHGDFISPPFSHIVYRKSEKDEVFILLLLLMLIGEFFAAPTITLVDTVSIRQIKNNLNNYRLFRIWGSVGWAVMMLIVGVALDNSTEFSNHPCGAHIQERNYNVCFKIFAFLMTLACLVATQFNFDAKICSENEIDDQTAESNELNTRNSAGQGPQEATQAIPQSSQFVGSSTNSQPPPPTPPTRQPNEGSNGKKRKFELLDQWKSGVWSQRFNRRLEWLSLLKNITNIKLIALICLAWFMGAGVGLVFSFLFWHLQDLGGTPTLFGIASVINHISEIAAYFNSLYYIKKYGHTRVLTLALFCNFLRFLYISYIDNSWLILPFELVQGITHATVWACFCSYLNHTINDGSKGGSRDSTQALLQIVYSGFGKGLGSIIGGILISAYGTRVTFAIYAFSSLVAICIFVVIMNVYKRQLAPTVTALGEQTSGRNRQQWLDDDLKSRNLAVNENEFVQGGLSPHGVPTAPINRTSPKTSQPSASGKTRIEPKIAYNEEDAKIDEYITTNYREWRITMNRQPES